ncbi:hypothetical protein ACFL20_09410 [Spirochaetota bacterium]
MSYKRLILEQSDNDYDDYVPGRGESFSMGMMSGWESLLRALPWIIGGLILLFIFIII